MKHPEQEYYPPSSQYLVIKYIYSVKFLFCFGSVFVCLFFNLPTEEDVLVNNSASQSLPSVSYFPPSCLIHTMFIGATVYLNLARSCRITFSS